VLVFGLALVLDVLDVLDVLGRPILETHCISFVVLVSRISWLGCAVVGLGPDLFFRILVKRRRVVNKHCGTQESVTDRCVVAFVRALVPIPLFLLLEATVHRLLL
jgi:hypothetical protein